MLSAIAIVPSAPVMVPQLASGAAGELTDLRTAAVAAASALPARWVAVGVGRDDAVVGPQQHGTFAGYGVDIPVALSPDPDGPVTALPLCALITGWLREQAAPDAHAEVRVCADGIDADAAQERGRELRTELDAVADPVGLLIVADGAHTLTPSAPGGHDPDSVPVQAALDDALGSGNVAALTQLPDSIVGRVAFQVLGGATQAGVRSAKELYRGAPYGVGYFVGTWVS